MYPIIHDYAATDLTSQGYGALSDCILCEVTEELNGAFTLELQYPLHGLHAQYLVPGNIIVVIIEFGLIFNLLLFGLLREHLSVNVTILLSELVTT